MKNLIVSIFLIVISFSIIDTNDPKKVMIVVDYGDGQPIDRILLDKKDLVNHNRIWQAVEHVIDEREKNK